MAKQQRGVVAKRGDRNFGARYFDETGTRKYRGGFTTRTAAETWLRDKTTEIDAVRRGEAIPADQRAATVNHLLDVFVEKHGRTVDPATKKRLTVQLNKARAEFGDRQPDSLRRIELEDWQAALPDGSRQGVFTAFRQALAWGTARGLATRDASVGIRNPRRAKHERREVLPFETWDDVYALAEELDPRHRAIPIVAVGCGLRPEELFGLHRADLDRDQMVLHVRRRYTGGVVKPGTKTGPERAVPLRQAVLDALDAMPPRIDTPILLPAARGGYIHPDTFRDREWIPALRAAGLDHRRLYDCRHTFTTWAIDSGVQLSHLAVIMGTSVTQIEDTYARWLKRTDDRLRAVFDAYDQAAAG